MRRRLNLTQSKVLGVSVAVGNRNLKKYHAKRKFDDTPEPKGTVKSKGRLYVIQKHHATRLHWDLRLEYGGVLLSWAVPKEPTEDTSVRRLAVRVEDHPVDYATFEGTIPKGNYGAGKVEIWDRGTWTTDDDVDRGLAEGKLTFNIHGDRLNGSFALVRMGEPGEKENWLLLKHKEIKLEAPGFMLCRPVPKPPPGADWIHEIKWDGYRAMALVADGECRFLSRGGNELGVPDLQALVAKSFSNPAIVDGELIVLNDQGISDFGMLQATLKSDKKDICFVAFDLLHHDGEDLRSLPLEERREKLLALMPKKKNGRLRYSESFDTYNVFQAACQMGLEGIVSKRKGSSYRSGRFDDWRKAKCSGHEEFVVAGYTLMAGTTNSIGSLVVGQERNGRLEFAGRLGTGFDSKTRVDLLQQLEPLATKRAPFEVPDAKDRRGVKWVEPRMIVKGKFLNKTSRGVVRQARFDGVIDMAETRSESSIQSFKVSSGDRVVDKQSGATKQAVADYYVAILDRIFPQLRNRPISVIRCPDGVDGECFFQRHVKHEVGGTQGVPFKDEDYIGLVEPEGILNLVQFGGIEFHPWGSKIGDVRLPDRLIFDLDPGPKVDWKRVCEAARLLKDRVEGIGMAAFLKISGGKGLHVVCPIKPELEWEQAKAFTKTLAESLVKEHPDDFVSKMSKSIRDTKIFVDYLRNDQTSTAVAAYSLRSRAGMPCAWPIRWDDLEDFKGADEISISNFEEYLNQPDPWASLTRAEVSLKKLLGL
jgi:bifunctional non-homologous end joining protein LigD